MSKSANRKGYNENAAQEFGEQGFSMFLWY